MERRRSSLRARSRGMSARAAMRSGGEFWIATEAGDGLAVGEADGAERVEGDGELEDAGAENEVGGVDGGERGRVGGDLRSELLADHPGNGLEARDAGEEIHGNVGCAL